MSGGPMKPYFEALGVTLYHADCREVAPDLSGVRAVIADPPYGVTRLAWDRWPDGWIDALPSDALDLMVFGFLRTFLERAQDFSAWHLAQDLIWEKQNGSGFAADRFRRIHETVAHFYRGPWRTPPRRVPRVLARNPGAVGQMKRSGESRSHTGHTEPVAWEETGTRIARSILRVNNMQGRSLHPTEKPVSLLMVLIEACSEPGDLILDPFVGSGSALVAAMKSGRRAVGCEVDERYCDMAARRCQAAP